MRSEHDHWGELRALRRRLGQWDRMLASGECPAQEHREVRAAIWARYRELSLSLEALIDRLYGTRCPECGGELVSGYGYAYGPLGSYTFCGCGWHLLVPCSSE